MATSVSHRVGQQSGKAREAEEHGCRGCLRDALFLIDSACTFIYLCNDHRNLFSRYVIDHFPCGSSVSLKTSSSFLVCLYMPRHGTPGSAENLSNSLVTQPKSSGRRSPRQSGARCPIRLHRLGHIVSMTLP